MSSPFPRPAAALFLAATLVAQAPQHVPSARYVVMLKERSFDLSAYEAAVRSNGAIDGVRTIAGLEAAMRADQRGIVEFVTEELGGKVREQYWLINGLAVEIDPGRAERLAAHPRVCGLFPDQVRRPGRAIKTATNANNHATDSVQAQGILGKNMVLAVVDSGVDSNMNGTGRPHATFFVNGNVNNTTGGGIGGSRLLANKQIGLMSADDTIAHGTAVAGIAAGARWNAGPTADDGHAPLASVVSYSVADDAAGGCSYLTLTNAWQAVAADRLVYGTKVAVCSYEGYFLLSFPDQVAIDTLASSGDVVICGMAGNAGASAEYAYGATNMLAVGAVQPDTRAMASFSTRGPLLQTSRAYPDLVANGVGMVLPRADSESVDKVGSGTSYAAPHVAGAALLFRSLKPGATAAEVKAALLATCEDVSGKNPQAPYNTRNAYGLGYLRVDQLIALAQGKGIVTTGGVTTAVRSQTFNLAVQAGQRYAIAITWFRQNFAQESWADLDLAVMQGTQVLAQSVTAGNLNELVRFRAAATGQVSLVVTAKSFESGTTSQTFALAAADSLPYHVDPKSTTYGQACQGLTSLAQTAGEPRIGSSYQLSLAGPQLTATLSLVGASRTTWGAFALPLDLGPFGAPGCSVLTSSDVALAGVTDVYGRQIVNFAVPNDPVLLDVTIYHQSAVATPTNALGIALTNGLAQLLGGG